MINSKMAPQKPVVRRDQANFDPFSDPPNVLLYIDNSNIFESAKKYSGHKKGYLNGIPDVACRIDVGKLINTAVGTRGLLSGKLYGSEPPALDSVWEAIRRKRIHVETFQRSKWTLKEKETDTSLTAGAVEDIIIQKDAAGPDRTVVLFSGDRDLLPVVNTAIKYGYRVEIWSFEQYINNTVKRQASNNPDQLRVYPIDNIFHEITYTKVVWGNQKIPRERSLITEISLPADRDVKKFLREFVSKACDNFKLPIMGRYLKDYKYIVLVPCIKEHYKPKSGSEQQHTTRTYDYYSHIQPFTHMMDEYYKKLGIPIQLQAWNEFLASRRTSTENSIISGNRFQALIVEDDDEADDNFLSDDVDSIEFFDYHHEDSSDAGDDGDFVPVLRKEVKPTRMYSTSCLNKFWCSRGKCPYVHTKEEKEFFKVQPDAKIRRLYKIKPCYYLVCRYADKTYLCGYAHTLEESRCLCCKQQGNGEHWMDQCPLKTEAKN